MPCPLCLDNHYDSVCELCKLALFQTEEILDAYSAGGVRPEQVRFFVPEISFTFERDPRTRRFFTVAYQIIEKAVTIRNQEMFVKRGISSGDIELMPSEYILPINEVRALRSLPRKRIREIDEVLSKARIARFEGETIYIEEMAQKLVSYIPSGGDLTGEAYQQVVKEMKGVLCVILADTLIRKWLDGDIESGRPRKYVVYMKCLSRFWRKYWEEEVIPQEISIRRFFEPRDLQVSSEQAESTFGEDVLGLGTGQSNIIQNFREKSDGKIVLSLKEPVVRFIERMRERWRERERERQG